MTSLEKLIYMANQIARNFATMNDVDAAKAVADHIAKYWDPRMKMMIFEYADEGDEELSEVAKQAIDELREHGAPPPQTRATEFNAVDEGDGSDAG